MILFPSKNKQISLAIPDTMTLVHMGESISKAISNSKSKLLPTPTPFPRSILLNIPLQRLTQSPASAAPVFFKFRPDVPLAQKETFVRELRKLKALPSVKGGRLLVGGGPSVTSPIEKSQGYEYALVSYHEDLEALEEYQRSGEHKWSVFFFFFSFWLSLGFWFAAEWGERVVRTVDAGRWEVGGGGDEGEGRRGWLSVTNIANRPWAFVG